jgi:hypothetical protein
VTCQFEEIKTRLVSGPVKFRLLLVITIRSTVADNAKAENDLAFDPARLADGIELSNDPLPALRSRVYAKAVAILRSRNQRGEFGRTNGDRGKWPQALTIGACAGNEE